MLGLVDTDEGILEPRVVDHHRTLRTIDVGQMNVADQNAAPLELAEAMAAENVQRTARVDAPGGLRRPPGTTV